MTRFLTSSPTPVWPDDEPAGWMWLKVAAGAAAFSFMMIGVAAFLSVMGD